MGKTRATIDDPAISLVRGIPLCEEEGIGALTIAGYLREVCSRYAQREAVVFNHAGSVERWSYQELWDRSMVVAKALVASGVGKDSRVGILMTNRPEYLSALFGTALAGGVCVALSTFSTPAELEHLIAASGISTLLFEDAVLNKDFATMLATLESGVKSSAPGQLDSVRFPFPRQLVLLKGVTAVATDGDSAHACRAYERWDSFLEKSVAIPTELVEARAASVHPADAGGLFFSSGC